MRRQLLVSSMLGIGITALAAGCETTYWVRPSDLRLAQQKQEAVSKQSLALQAVPSPTANATPVYLRYSMLNPVPAAAQDGPEYVAVKVPKRRPKSIAGIVLLGLGVPITAGALAQIFYGVSLRSHDKLGAGIVAGLAGIPLALGISLLIPGAVLVGKKGHISDPVAPGDPSMTYIPESANLGK